MILGSTISQSPPSYWGYCSSKHPKPHQLTKAKQKEALKECKIVEGDAEDLPFGTDYADRYVSAGSIEYWPDPQRGIKEAYRVLKLGGKACLIGPVYPTFSLSRFFADVWMLFPKEEEYIEWFQKAGFKDVQLKRIGLKWYRGVRRHGLIMGCSVTGVESAYGDSPLQMRFIDAMFASQKAQSITQVVMNLPNDAAEYLGPGTFQYAKYSRLTYSDLCHQIPESKFRQCLLTTLAALFKLMSSYQAVMSFQLADKVMTNQEAVECIRNIKDAKAAAKHLTC
ncbi:unnamed protein product [Camellia sinensis]